MGKQHNIYPPIDNRRARVRKRLFRWLINLFVLVGVAVLYYIVISSLFDTPREHRMRQQTARLRSEYGALSKRLGEVEDALNNVVERDRNVFHILFESEPYDFTGGYESSRWAALDDMHAKSNNELNDILLRQIDDLDYNMRRLDALYTHLSDTMAARPDKNSIPAIQPVINQELTLLTASFGKRIHPFYKMLSQHNGADFTVPEGSRVFATADGVVKETAKRPSSSGVTVVIDHGNGYETYYNHLGSLLVNRGQRVRRGDIIALTGNSGLSLIPHLHYEVRYKGTPVDPIHYFFMELSPEDYQRMIRIARSGMQSFD